MNYQFCEGPGPTDTWLKYCGTAGKPSGKRRTWVTRLKNKGGISMYRNIVLIIFILLTVSSVDAASLSSGTYPVEVYQGDRTYTSYWMIRVDNSNISGMSDWKALYGHRQFIQSLKGTVSENQVTITRHCAEPELSSCIQTYSGTTRSDLIEGNWSGTGGAGTWKLFLNRPLNR